MSQFHLYECSAWRRRPIRLSALVLLVGLAGGCAPLQSGRDQVPDINVNINTLKDAAFVGMPASVDAMMASFIAASGDYANKTPIPG